MGVCWILKAAVPQKPKGMRTEDVPSSHMQEMRQDNMGRMRQPCRAGHAQRAEVQALHVRCTCRPIQGDTFHRGGTVRQALQSGLDDQSVSIVLVLRSWAVNEQFRNALVFPLFQMPTSSATGMVAALARPFSTVRQLRNSGRRWTLKPSTAKSSYCGSISGASWASVIRRSRSVRETLIPRMIWTWWTGGDHFPRTPGRPNSGREDTS